MFFLLCFDFLFRIETIHYAQRIDHEFIFYTKPDFLPCAARLSSTMRSSAMINDVIAALISVFYWLQNQHVLHQTPIEINPLLEKPKRTWPQT